MENMSKFIMLPFYIAGNKRIFLNNSEKFTLLCCMATTFNIYFLYTEETSDAKFKCQMQALWNN